MPTTRMDIRCLELEGGWEVKFNEEPFLRAPPVVSQCTVKLHQPSNAS